MSILGGYDGSSFWINILYKSQKQTSIPKYNSTLHTLKNRFSSQLPVLRFYRDNCIKNPPERVVFSSLFMVELPDTASGSA